MNQTATQNSSRLSKPIPLLLASAFALSGCFDSDGLSESSAKDAVQKALSGSMYCLDWPSKSPETAILFDKETEFLKQIASYGWVNVSTDTAGNVFNTVWYTSTPKDGYAVAFNMRMQIKSGTNLYVVRLTEKGRAQHKPAANEPETGRGSAGLCSGERTVAAIKRFSAPAADASGKIVSEVAFRFDFKSLLPEMKPLWDDEKGKTPAGQESVGIVQLMKTNNGWITNGPIRYRQEKT